MTGELVLQELRELESRRLYAERLSAALVKEGARKLVAARDEFEDEGGMVVSWKDDGTGRRFCQLVLNGERVALASSDQSSADAEAHAFQNLNNDRANAARRIA